MSAHVLISGILQRKPESRTAKSGNAYGLATIRVRDGNETQFWSVLAFGETARAELLRLGEGEAVTAQGKLDVSIQERDGQQRIRYGVMADNVLGLRQPPRERATRKTSTDRSAPPADQRTREERCRGVADPDLNDPIPF
ncbi:MAG: single-stranded DNA-binding protein [Rhodoblastus sp.]|nr:single-stranded DNA-binding protein [Rhodoblastus sp.]